MKRKNWTGKEIQWLRKHYPNTPTRLLCIHLGRSYSSVAGKALEHKLKKSEEFMKDPTLSGRLTGELGKDTRFKPGQKAWNKGMKGLQIGGVHTRFKPGNKPHNTKHDGAVSIRDGYQYIRISEGEWIPLHHHVWQQEHGPVPEGYNLIFKDKNRMNCHLDNLELVSNDELMRRNTLHRYPKEIADTIRINGVLKRHINKYEQKDN